MTIKEIESAILQLPLAERAELAAWLDELQAQAWDEQIERDLKAGRLDHLIQQAKEEIAAGRYRPL
jgi:hypothetical protein